MKDKSAPKRREEEREAEEWSGVEWSGVEVKERRSEAGCV